jgi:DNA-binding XRE family transcriptional regulator
VSDVRNRTWEEARDELHAADPELAKLYEAGRPAFLAAREVLRARRRLNLTQKQVADLVGVTQSQVSRIEHMDTTPSLTTVHRFAVALGCELDIRFKRPA